jgi:hypothetical protein
MRSFVRVTRVPRLECRNVAPTSDQIEDRIVGMILENLQPHKTNLIIYQARPIQECLPYVLLSPMEDSETRHRNDHMILRSSTSIVR